MTRVDPFIPVKPAKKPLPGLVNNIPSKVSKLPTTPTAPISKAPAQITPQPPAPIAVQPPSKKTTAMQLQPPQKPKQQLASALQTSIRPDIRPAHRKLQETPRSPSPRRNDFRPAPTPTPATPQPSRLPAKTKRRRLRISREKLETLFGLLLIAGIGMGLQSLMFGQLCVVAYGVFALVRRVPSSTTLSLAGISLMSIIVMAILNSYNPLIPNFAVYSFLLLLIGVISLVREILAQTKEAKST